MQDGYILACVVALSLGVPSVAQTAEPVAHYTFAEGAGEVVKDATGNGNNGQIHGAEFITGKAGSALRFNGETDYVDFGDAPGLKFADAVTIAAWVYPESVPVCHSLIVGRKVGAFGLFQHSMLAYAIGWAVPNHRVYASARMSRNKWSHVAMTFDGKVLKLYINGSLRTASESFGEQISNDSAFRMGGAPAARKEDGFKGLLTDVRLYDRAHSADEINASFMEKPGLTEEEIATILADEASALAFTNELAAKPYAYYFDKRVVVALDSSGLGELPAGSRAVVALGRQGNAGALHEKDVPLRTASSEASVSFTNLQLLPGEYEVAAKVVDRDGQQIGAGSSGKFSWPQELSWPGQTAKMKVLNNLVTELLNVKLPAGSEYTFTNPREGWVFVASTARVNTGARLWIGVDSTAREAAVIDHGEEQPPTVEAMRFLPAGPHRLTIARQGKPVLEKLVVRAIPHLAYSGFPRTSRIKNHGPYDWEYLEKHDILATANTMVGRIHPYLQPYYEQWAGQGKKWVDDVSLPYSKQAGQDLTADDAYQYWTKKPGFQLPFVNGVMGNEVHGGSAAEWAAWSGAIRRIQADKQFADRGVYPYCGPLYQDSAGAEFLRMCMDFGYWFSWELYLGEQPTEYGARELLNEKIRENLLGWKTTIPGSERYLVLNLGYFNCPYLSTSVNPGVDFKVFLEMIFSLAANDSEFFGLRGFQVYHSEYVDEELVRWAAKLFRHYCIEGKTSLLSPDPYALTHIRNPDFDDGLSGWTVAAAEADSIEVKYLDGFGYFQGRYLNNAEPPNYGNHFLWMKRSRLRPNACSQAIRNLQPGKLYSAKVLSGDYADLLNGEDVKKMLPLSVSIEGAEVIADKSFQEGWRSNYQNDLGARSGTYYYWMNLHRIVFRATSEEAQLVISDWIGDADPGGPIGQEIICNFIEIQPYLE